METLWCFGVVKELQHKLDLVGNLDCYWHLHLFDYIFRDLTLSQQAVLLQLKIVTSAVSVSKAKLQFLVTH